MKIAVIGAGAAGLCCARHLSRYPEYFQFQILEKTKVLGGTWVYSPTTSREEQAYSSMYKNLRTNLPKEVMFFPGFPFPSHWPSFLRHSQVLEYLQSYASHYNIIPFIKFGTLVDQVKLCHTGNTKAPVSMEDSDQEAEGIHFHNCNVKWQVTMQDMETGIRTSEEYDAVLVCNGHFSAPEVPALPGLPLFPGHVIHSHVYREPEVYKDQNVAVVGSGQSGRDIILDLSTCARQVYLCNRGPSLVCPIPDNVEELSDIAEVGADGVVHFTDGKKRLVDSIILATGYMYSFPFLSEEAGVKVKSGKRVTPLYKHTFNPIHPSMAFIGLNFGFNPFPYFDYQVRWVLAVWAGDKSLPSLEEMIKDDDDWYESRLQSGLPPHKAGHFLGSAQWDMIYLLAKLGGNRPLDPVMEKLYKEITRERTENLMQYKNNNYTVLGEDKWARIEQ